MRVLRILVPVLVILVILAGLTWFGSTPQRSSAQNFIQSPTRLELTKGDDSPWDPGDERDPHPSPRPKHGKSAHKMIILAQNKPDKPWDPGDESHKETGGRLCKA